MGSQQEEIQTTEIGAINDTEISQKIKLSSPFPNYSLDNSFSTQSISWSYPGSVSDSTAYINGYFRSWNIFTINPLSLEDSVYRMARNIDLIMRQASESFYALDLNESKIVAEMYDITDPLQYSVNNLTAWRTTATNSLNSLSDYIDRVDANRVSNYNSLSGRIDTVNNNRISNYNTLNGRINDVSSYADDINDYVERVDNLRISNYNYLLGRINDVSTFANDINDYVERVDNLRVSNYNSLYSRITDLNNARVSDITGLKTRTSDLESRYENKIDVNLNTITKSGTYYVSGGANMPPGKATGLLRVSAISSGTVIHQEYLSSSNPQQKFVRSFTSDAWGSWIETTTTKADIDDLQSKDNYFQGLINTLTSKVSDLSIFQTAQLAWNLVQENALSNEKKSREDADKALQTDITGLKTRTSDLESRYENKIDVDLNTITKSGTYYVSGGANMPPGKATGLLRVSAISSGTVIHQEYLSSSNPQQKFVRSFTSDAWGSWIETTTTKADIDDLQSKDNYFQGLINTLTSKVSDLSIFQTAQLAWNLVQENALSNEKKSREDADKALQSDIESVKGRFRNISNIDLNTVTKSGLYYVVKGTGSNFPPNLSGGMLQVISTSTESVVSQEFIDYRNTEVKFVRNKSANSDTWSVWKEVTVTKSDIDSLNTRDDLLQLRIDNLNDLRVSNYQTLYTRITDLNNDRVADNRETNTRIKNLEDEFNSFDLNDAIDLTVLVHAIDVVRDRVIDVHDELVNLNNSFKAGGFAYSLVYGAVTGQTSALTSVLNQFKSNVQAQFDIYFGDWEDGLFWKANSDFVHRQMAIWFGVFQDDILDPWWLEALDMWLSTNDSLINVNDWLEMIYEYSKQSRDILAIVTNWLEKIYQKPSSVFVDTPFDYERLQEMLNNLEFGDIVNEAGTNIWDFLSTLVGELGDTLQAILDFLDSLLDKVIELFVPSDTSFIGDSFDSIKVKFNVKFGSILGLADQVKNIFVPSSKDFKESISFEFMGSKFSPDLTLLDPYVSKFRGLMSLSIWMSVAIYIFRKITGNGDLVNDN